MVLDIRCMALSIMNLDVFYLFLEYIINFRASFQKFVENISLI